MWPIGAQLTGKVYAFAVTDSATDKQLASFMVTIKVCYILQKQKHEEIKMPGNEGDTHPAFHLLNQQRIRGVGQCCSEDKQTPSSLYVIVHTITHEHRRCR